jgi:carboxymethylenebutenolidase
MRRFAPLLAVFFLVACTPVTPTDTNSSSSSAAAVTGSGGTVSANTEAVDYGPATGYLARPDGDGPHPAIILIHEFWGLNDNMKWYAEQFAKEGYVALAVDLYGESTTDQARARELASSVRGNVEPAFENLKAAVAYLKSRDDVNDALIASVGWCFGGGWSYQMAKNDLGVKASVMYYGQFAPEDDLSMMKAHIIGHFGEDDTGIPVDDVKAFRAKLQTQSGEHEIFIYENVGHGFARELTTDSAKQAWTRTLEFLKEQL